MSLIASHRSFFQSVCTLGYCLLPLVVAILVSRVLLTTGLPDFAVHMNQLIVVVISLFWLVWGECIIFCTHLHDLRILHFLPLSPASLDFLLDYLPTDRKALAVYPILLFYFSISYLIAAQTDSLI